MYDNEEIARKIGRLVEQNRKLRGMSQEQLAEEIGSEQSVISNIESAKGVPSLKMLNRIAKGLDAELVLPKLIIKK